MLLSKKKKIQEYLNSLGDKSSVFDTFLRDYVNNNLQKELESLGFTKISIHIDWIEKYQCIAISCRYRHYYVDIQIHRDTFSISYDEVEPDEDRIYPLESKHHVYKALSDTVQMMKKEKIHL